MSKIDRSRVRRSFDSQAHEYDRHAIVQKRVLERFIRVVPRGIIPASILDIGSGTGVLMQKLARRYPGASLVGMDMAYGMGVTARERFVGNGRVSFVTADAEHLPFGHASFDLVVSTSTFQWLDSLDAAFGQIRRVLNPGGRFCFALFGEKTLYELRESYRAAVESFGEGEWDRTHRFKGCDDIFTALVLAGLEAEYLTSELEVERHQDVTHLLRCIRGIGAGNAAPSGRRGFAERRIMLDMMERYRRRYGDGDGIPATYEVIYGVARKS